MNDNKYPRLLGIEDFRKAPALTRMAILQNIRQLIDAGADMGMVWAKNMTTVDFRLKWGVSTEEIWKRITIIRAATTSVTSDLKGTGEAWSWMIDVVKRRAIKDDIEERERKIKG